MPLTDKEVWLVIHGMGLGATFLLAAADTLGERLRSRSKPGKVRVLAAANKLLRTCFGVLKHQQPYNLNWRPSDLLDSPG